MESIYLKNGRIWDGEKFGVGDVYVEKGVIAGIFREGKAGNAHDSTVMQETEEKAADTKALREQLCENAQFVYDAKGKIISPGLVDIHTHFRGISCDTWGIHTEMGYLPFGVTAAADASASQGNRDRLDFYPVKNRVFVSIGYGGDAASAKGAEVYERAEELLQAYGDKAIGVKVAFDTSAYPDITLDDLRKASEYAAKKQLKLMVHSSNSPVSMAEILEVLKPGDILTHAYHGGINTSLEDDFASLMAAKARGVIIDVGMAGYVHTDFGVLKAAVEKGALPNTISTDITCASAYVRGGKYGLPMCMSILRHLGMPEEAVFRAVTSDAAEALGCQDSWGRLEAGRCADIAVLADTEEGFDMTDRAGNRVHSDHGYRCVLTIADGQVVYRY